MVSLFHLARQNLICRIYRSLIIILGIAGGAGLLLFGALLLKGVENGLQSGLSRLGAELIVVPAGYEHPARTALLVGEPSMFYMHRDVEQQVAKVAGVEKVSSQVFVQSAQASCCSAGNVLLIGFDPASDFTVLPWARQRKSKLPGENELIAGAGLQTLPGQPLKFFNYEFKVAANLEATGFGFFDNAVFMPVETAYRMALLSRTRKNTVPVKLTPGQISALLIRVKPGVTPQAVARSISQAVPGVKVLVSEGIVSTVRQRLAVPVKNLALSGAVMWLVVFLMTAALLTMMAAERKREFGLLRAMGASRRFLIQLIILEAGILTALGGLFGVIGSGILIYAFKNLLIYTLELPFHWPAWSRLTGLVASILLLSVLAGVLSAAYPAYRYSQLDPYDAIRAGE